MNSLSERDYAKSLGLIKGKEDIGKLKAEI
jgi:hypothetical protein